MIQILTDEESIEHSDKLIATVANAMACTVRMHPGTTIEALSQILFMVNGQNWMGCTDMARARVAAKAKARYSVATATTPERPGSDLIPMSWGGGGS